MPGVLVESSASPPHGFFPVGSSFFDNSNGFDVGCPRPDLAPLSPSLSYLDALASSPPSFRPRETAPRFLPKSNLGLGLNGSLMECSPELAGMPIPSPFTSSSSSAESMVGSPLFHESNGVGSPVLADAFAALHRFLPSNTNDDESWPADALPAMDAYSCDDFRMYEFKVRRCMRGRSHDWTECPFAHPGEKARRRDPRRIHYSGTACPDFRKGNCKRGDTCDYAHGVFECWLHPARYRTQPCKDGRACQRRVCFFAHTVEQLRVLPSASTSSAIASTSPRNVEHCEGSPSFQSLPGSLLFGNSNDCSASEESEGLAAPRILHRRVLEGKGSGSRSYGGSLSSFPSASLQSSPPVSPDVCWQRTLGSPQSLAHVHLSTALPVPGHRRHLNRLQTIPTLSIPSDATDYMAEAATSGDMSFSLPASAHAHSPHDAGASDLLHSFQTFQLCSRIAELQNSASTPSSPRSLKYSPSHHSPLRQSLYHSIQVTPVSDKSWDLSRDTLTDVDPLFRVESGRDLRAEIYGKIGKENGVDCNTYPDLGGYCDLRSGSTHGHLLGSKFDCGLT